MSLTGALSSAMTGLKVSSTRIQVAADNIANAQQAGYSRRALTTTTSLTGDVLITGYSHAQDKALSLSLNLSLSDAGYRDAQNAALQEVQATLGNIGGDTPPLAAAISDFSTAWQTFSNADNPSSGNAQAPVIQAGQNVVDQIKRASVAVDNLDQSLRQSTTDTVTQLNTTLKAIASLQQNITSTLAEHQDASALQDQRNLLVQQVASIVRIQTFDRGNGNLAIYTSSGYALMDGAASITLQYNGTDVTESGNPTVSLNGALVGGKLQGLLDLRADTSPAAVSSAPGSEVIRKLRSQLDAVVTAFTTIAAGPPETFGNAYNAATGQAGEAAAFFTGTDRYTFAVTPTLLNGTETLKSASNKSVYATFLSSTRTFSADGLALTGASYESLGVGIATASQQAANTVKSLNDTAQSQKTYFTQRLADATGVNVDEETVNISTLQSLYSACARVVSVVDDLFKILRDI